MLNNCKDKGKIRRNSHVDIFIKQHIGISRKLTSYPSATFEEFIEILNRILTDDQLGLKI